MIGVFDLSIAEITSSTATSGTPTPHSTITTAAPASAVSRREQEVQLVAQTVGDVRRLLAAFFHRYIGFSESQVGFLIFANSLPLL